MSASRAWNRWLNPEVDRATEWQRVEAVLAKHFEDMSGHVSPHLAREAEGWRVVSAMTDTGHDWREQVVKALREAGLPVAH